MRVSSQYVWKIYFLKVKNVVNKISIKCPLSYDNCSSIINYDSPNVKKILSDDILLKLMIELKNIDYGSRMILMILKYKT